MSQRKKGVLMLCLLFGIPLFITGILGTVKNEEYTLPVYISQELQVYGNDNKTVLGQLKNRTNETIKIEKLVIRISTDMQWKTVYYDFLELKDIMMPAYSIYDIYETGIASSVTKASISYCVINGENCNLKYSSDEILFDDSSNDNIIFILMLVGGIVSIGVIVYIITFYFIEKKKIKY